MQIGNRIFDTANHCYIMGILNMTPDSFSDGGKYQQMDRALFRVEEMIKEGADIIDVGGESTRPGYLKISVEQEIERIADVIKNIKSRFDVPVSLDTYKSEAAEAGIHAGIDLVNDIWGLKYDENLAGMIAKTGVCCCLVHNGRTDENNQKPKKSVIMSRGGSIITEVINDLKESVNLAVKAGVDENKIILDPGIGFGKSYEENLELTANLDRLKGMGHPLLFGASRKSMIGSALDLPVEERLEGTLAATVFAVLKGCSFVRVHDIKENVRVVKMTEALKPYLPKEALR